MVTHATCRRPAGSSPQYVFRERPAATPQALLRVTEKDAATQRNRPWPGRGQMLAQTPEGCIKIWTRMSTILCWMLCGSTAFSRPSYLLQERAEDHTINNSEHLSERKLRKSHFDVPKHHKKRPTQPWMLPLPCACHCQLLSSCLPEPTMLLALGSYVLQVFCDFQWPLWTP